MTEIVLSTPGYLNAPFAKMEFDTLRNILKKVAIRKHAHVYCHAHWSQPVDSLEWLISESKKMGLSLTLCLTSSDTIEHLHSLLSEDFAIEVSLLPGSTPHCLSELVDFQKISFFLPLERPDAYPAPSQGSNGTVPSSAENSDWRGLDTSSIRAGSDFQRSSSIMGGKSSVPH